MWCKLDWVGSAWVCVMSVLMLANKQALGPWYPSCNKFILFLLFLELVNCIIIHYNLFFAVSWEHSGISGYGIHSNYWTVHCLCPAHLLQSDFSTQVLHPWTLQFGSLWNHCWMGCRSLGCNHLSSLLIACSLSHYQWDSKLYSCSSWLFVCPYCFFLDLQCSSLV